jgi:hypothetical protein
MDFEGSGRTLIEGLRETTKNHKITDIPTDWNRARPQYEFRAVLPNHFRTATQF